MEDCTPRISLLSSHAEELLSFLVSHPHNHERAAIVLFRRLSQRVQGLSDSDRYLSIRVIPFDDEWIKSSSPEHIDFNMAPLRPFFQEVEEKDLVFGFVHNHPTGFETFSERDRDNEIRLVTAIKNRNGSESYLVSLLWTQNQWKARVLDGKESNRVIPVRHTCVVGQNFEIFGNQKLDKIGSEIFARQQAAFGKPFTAKLQSLRVAIVGAGGTGSPAAALLARAGVGELVIIDKDVFEKSNLNRLHGSKKSDDGKKKTKILTEFIKGIGLPVKVGYVSQNIDDNIEAVDTLASADIVFGCTDDFIGRDVLNVAVYYYYQVLIDIGLSGYIKENSYGEMRLHGHQARISTILPEKGSCLYCQRVITTDWINTQYERRSNPDITEEELKEKYLTGGAEEAPGVGPFTGMAANFGVATLFQLIQPYRHLPSHLLSDNIWVDFVNMEFKSQSPIDDKDCPYCGRRQFLGASEVEGRLGRPSLRS